MAGLGSEKPIVSDPRRAVSVFGGGRGGQAGGEVVELHMGTVISVWWLDYHIRLVVLMRKALKLAAFVGGIGALAWGMRKRIRIAIGGGETPDPDFHVVEPAPLADTGETGAPTEAPLADAGETPAPTEAPLADVTDVSSSDLDTDDHSSGVSDDTA